MNKESRKFDRVNALVPLSVLPLSKASPGNYFCRLDEQDFDDYLKIVLYKDLDISGAGISFESHVPFAVGGILEVRIKLDDIYPGRIQLYLEVMRVDVSPDGYRIAGRYVDLDKDIRKLILQFISARKNRVAKKKIAV
jgi:hypothetical protein